MVVSTLLFTNIDRLSTDTNQKTIVECFCEELERSDSLEILVGYCSSNSLERLNELVIQKDLKNICLILGMYYFEGFPETIYETIAGINKKWMELKIGEIRVTHEFKYHGKLYCFYRDGQPISAILGSANFSFLEKQEKDQRQYEMATLFKELGIVRQISIHINEIKKEDYSRNIFSLEGIRIVRNQGESLPQSKLITQTKEEKAPKVKAKNIFYLPLKVPSEKNKFNSDRSNYTKSNLNTCYGKPRDKNGPARSWWEVQITVSKKITSSKGYPKRDKWFYVITDDGHTFKARATGDNGTQFVAIGDEQILGRWIKGKLVSLGIVSPIEDVSLDINREGMITKEMLEKYGGDQLILWNIGEKAVDKEGQSRGVWYLSFPRKTSTSQA